jgi:hypothetical protein
MIAETLACRLPRLAGRPRPPLALTPAGATSGLALTPRSATAQLALTSEGAAVRWRLTCVVQAQLTCVCAWARFHCTCVSLSLGHRAGLAPPACQGKGAQAGRPSPEPGPHPSPCLRHLRPPGRLWILNSPGMISRWYSYATRRHKLRRTRLETVAKACRNRYETAGKGRRRGAFTLPMAAGSLSGPPLLLVRASPALSALRKLLSPIGGFYP